MNVIIEKEQQRKRGKKAETNSESKSKSKTDLEAAPLAPQAAPEEKKIRKRKILNKSAKVLNSGAVGRKPGVRGGARTQLAALAVRRRNFKVQKPKITGKRILQKLRRISPRRWKKNPDGSGLGPGSSSGARLGPGLRSGSGPGPSGVRKENLA